MRITYVCIALLVVVGLPAIGAETHSVSMSEIAFDPPSITITVGDSVRFTNDSTISHTAQADGGFNSGNMTPGQQFVAGPFTSAGTINYYCLYHRGTTMMVGTITVQGQGQGSPPPQPKSSPTAASGTTNPSGGPTTKSPSPSPSISIAPTATYAEDETIAGEVSPSSSPNPGPVAMAGGQQGRPTGMSLLAAALWLLVGSSVGWVWRKRNTAAA